jgi:predicted ATPase
VGRATELALLCHGYEQSRHGHRQVLFVTGEAGMGKTTLVDAFTTQLEQDGSLGIGWGQCVEQYGAGEAYLPLLEAVSRLCRGPRAEAIITHLRQYAPSWWVQLPMVVGEKERAALQHRVQGAPGAGDHAHSLAAGAG